MKRVSFIRQTLLRDVMGRIDYISNPTRQDHLYATYETNPQPFWEELARENQFEFLTEPIFNRAFLTEPNRARIRPSV